MSEKGPSPEQEITKKPEVAQQQDITKRLEYAQACKNTGSSGDLVNELLKLGLSKEELKPFALDRLKDHITKGYGLAAVERIAKQSEVISEAEVNTLFAETKAEMATEPPSTKTQEEIAEEQAKFIDDMLSQYNK